MHRVVIFASGSGSNAENLITYFKNSPRVHIVKVYSNKKDAGVFERCKRLQVACEFFQKEDLNHSEVFIQNLAQEADYIILAGFLLKIPEGLLKTFPNKIVNIHPALLPKYGGKGMYGMHVHKAVKEHKETETGISIHYVNEHYDEGAIIFQAKTPILDSDTPEDIAQKIHSLEYEHFPKVIEALLS